VRKAKRELKKNGDEKEAKGTNGNFGNIFSIFQTEDKKAGGDPKGKSKGFWGWSRMGASSGTGATNRQQFVTNRLRGRKKTRGARNRLGSREGLKPGK